jgi:transposase-like protein
MRKRKHSPEFREHAVKQTLTGDESIKDRDAGLGISYWIG